ncbi:phosphonoacetaldehyde reductase [Micromonospora sp. WMMD1082]|uniref:phosphonoacetaldehyde reductase n=1 Tax=Micromonospora sp. WMMD1082 TaxID=3016104 RepID=UPI0024159781|nr:phosphonoacetaldehyde reductase [Micromonospora sp. WMMD1082]MDG4795537.1 phosphonoacetaldehyde reductase [Micromonospora sp. WMMD1082]
MSMATQITIAHAASRRLPAVLAAWQACRVLVVASPRGARRSGVRDLLTPFDVHFFSGFRPNPTLGQAVAAAEHLARYRPDAIIAIGGGSAIDIAKLARALPADTVAARQVLVGAASLGRNDRIPLVAVPTTAGSGSEVTRFATVYLNGVKHSLDHPSVLPDHALIDPDLIVTCPPQLRYACAFDALSHSVESYWSVRADDTSQTLAMSALRELLSLLDGGLNRLDDDAALRLATAATTAGRAIDRTRTTAAHAFSYHLTARHGVPHGVACLLNLVWLADHNREAVGAEATPAGLAVRAVVETIVGFGPGHDPGAALRRQLERGGYSSRLRDYGIHHHDLPEIMRAGLESARAGNNPCALVPDEIRKRLEALL